jgi:ParB/RepB/Spo0J family partition protein
MEHTIVTADPGHLIDIEVAGLIPNSWNHRRIDAEDLKELAASMSAQGVLEPLIVRVDPKNTGAREIIAGERRWRAAKLAKLKTVPCLIRQATDQEAREISAVENLQREQLTPLEEAENYALLLESKKVEDLEAVLGKKRSHIYSRLRLRALTEPARHALAAGTLEASCGNLLATIGNPETQKRALKEILEGGEWIEDPSGRRLGTRGPMSFRRAKALIEKEYRHPLHGAIFDLNTPLAGAPGCRECPKRTGNCPGVAGPPDVCTDPACFLRKDEACRLETLKPYKAKGHPVLSPAEAQKAIRKDWDGSLALAYDSPYVRSTDKVENDRKGRTYAALGKSVLPTIALGPAGQVIRLFVRKEIAPMLKAAGITAEPSHTHTSRGESAVSKAKRERAAKIEDRLQPRVGRAIAARVAGQYTEKLERRILAHVAHGFYFCGDGCRAGLKELGLERCSKANLDVAEWARLPTAKLCAAVAVGLLEKDYEDELAGDLGIKMGPLRKAAETEVEAELAIVEAAKAKPAPTKAKPAPAKGKAQKKPSGAKQKKSK